MSENRIWFGSDGRNVPRIKRFLSELPDGLVPRSILSHDVYGGTQKAANDLKKIFADKKIFDFSKPVDLIKYFINKASNIDDVILDFFAGSRVIIMTEANSSVKSKVLKLLPKLKTEETGNLCVA